MTKKKFKEKGERKEIKVISKKEKKIKVETVDLHLLITLFLNFESHWFCHIIWITDMCR